MVWYGMEWNEMAWHAFFILICGVGYGWNELILFGLIWQQGSRQAATAYIKGPFFSQLG